MPRRPRECPPPGIYHLGSRGNRRQPIFLDRRDREFFLALTAGVIATFAWRCLAYCLMDNHYHLLVRTTEPNLSAGMQRLNGGHAQRFNRRHGLDGHLFEDRFYCGAVESDLHLLDTARYIVANPIRAGICREPADWEWSSYRASMGACRPGIVAIRELLEHFGSTPAHGRRAFAHFVRERSAQASS